MMGTAAESLFSARIFSQNTCAVFLKAKTNASSLKVLAYTYGRKKKHAWGNHDYDVKIRIMTY